MYCNTIFLENVNIIDIFFKGKLERVSFRLLFAIFANMKVTKRTLCDTLTANYFIYAHCYIDIRLTQENSPWNIFFLEIFRENLSQCEYGIHEKFTFSPNWKKTFVNYEKFRGTELMICCRVNFKEYKSPTCKAAIYCIVKLIYLISLKTYPVTAAEIKTL
jgi:hypothetical protein